MAELQDLQVAGPAAFQGPVSVPDPTAGGHAASRSWVLVQIASAIGGGGGAPLPGTLNNRFWGVTANLTLTDAQIRALAGTDTTPSRTLSATLSPSNQFAVFAYPTRLGNLTSVLVDGLQSFSAMTQLAEVPVTIGGVTEAFKVWRTTNPLSGTITFQFN